MRGKIRQQKPKKLKLWAKILIGFGATVGGLVIISPIWGMVFGGPSIEDRINALSFQPTSEITSIVNRSGMNDNGRFFFFVGRPELNNREKFNINCADVMHEETVVLGCYNGRIFLFNITDNRIQGIKVVTAVHEMLHVVYARLGIIEQNRIDELLRHELSITTDESILNLVELYDVTEPGQRWNELHSIFATESAKLSSDLENYYSRFFADRQKVVAENAKYNEVFTAMMKQAEKMEEQLTYLSEEIESRKIKYESRINQLSSDISRFNSCAETAGCFASEYLFNVQRNGLLAEQNALNVEADAINALIAEYNRIVTELQALGREVEKLQNNLNSQHLL